MSKQTQQSYHFNLALTYLNLNLPQLSFEHLIKALEQAQYNMTTSQKHILIQSYRKIIEPTKNALKSFQSKYKKMEGEDKHSLRKVVKRCAAEVRYQLKFLCESFIKALQVYIGRVVIDTEGKVLVWKIKGDLWRCLWEVLRKCRYVDKQAAIKKKQPLSKTKIEQNQKNSISQSEICYKNAIQVSKAYQATQKNSLILGLLLNYSLLSYYAKGDISAAYEIASKALQLAQKHTNNKQMQDDEDDEDERNQEEECDKIKQFLQANLKLWTDDEND